MYFSKSKYCGLWQCPKIAWMNKYKPEERVIDESVKMRMARGDEVGDLAMRLFGDFVEVTVKDEEGKVVIPAMIERTGEELAKGTRVICEASFEYNGLYCAVDILKREGDGFAIYEVKCSSEEEEEEKKKL